mmetsp:Transcript_12164/g.23601  ORF Transcript_12164/g.23601 Transcript_12164/m.23601 type:complete len:202 (-) Transcript_12164:2127-2732(-)
MLLLPLLLLLSCRAQDVRSSLSRHQHPLTHKPVAIAPHQHGRREPLICCYFACLLQLQLRSSDYGVLSHDAGCYLWSPGTGFCPHCSQLSQGLRHRYLVLSQGLRHRYLVREAGTASRAIVPWVSPHPLLPTRHTWHTACSCDTASSSACNTSLCSPMDLCSHRVVEASLCTMHTFELSRRDKTATRAWKRRSSRTCLHTT